MSPTIRQSHYRLANQIVNLIVDAQFKPGHRLREQQLGNHLDVSRTPVRAALSLLADRGIVSSRRNLGYVLARLPDDNDRADIKAPVPPEQDLYERIVRDRLAADIPLAVTQSDIVRRYGADRGVLQRVLSRLTEDGLVTRDRGRGWSFLPTLDTGVALRDSYDFRLTIEPVAFTLATFRIDAATLERSRLQHIYFEAHPDIGTVDRRELFEADAAFHEMIAAFSGNTYFLQAMQQQNRLRRFLEFGGYTNRRRVRDWCREHLAIIEALRMGQIDKASELMRIHLARAFEIAPVITVAPAQADHASGPLDIGRRSTPQGLRKGS